MSSITDYLEDRWLAHITEGGSGFTGPTTLWIQLDEAPPTEAGVGSPPGDLLREGVPANTTNWGFEDANFRVIKNNLDIEWSQAVPGPAAWQITHFSIWDSQTSGQMLAYGAVSNATVTIDPGNFAKIAADTLKIEILTNDPSQYNVTDYLSQRLHQMTWQSVPFPKPADNYIAVSTSAVSDTTTTPTEPSDPAYSRQQITGWSAGTLGGNTAYRNANEIQFDADVGYPMTTVCLMDQAATGNLLMYGTPTPATTLTDNDTARFPADNIALTFD